MPFSIPEALSDLPAALALVQKIQASVSGLPPVAGRKAADYGKVIVAITPDLCALIDVVEEQAKS